MRTRALSHAQIPLWIAQQRHPRSALYNMAFGFVFDRALDPIRFRRAWQAVVDGSEILRSALAAERPAEASSGGTTAELDAWGQCRILPRTSCSTQVHSQTMTREGFWTWAEQRCAETLDPHDALVDSVLVPLQRGGTGWYLDQHHLVTDATSCLLLYEAVAAQYESLGDGGPSSPQPPSSRSSYYDIAARVSEAARTAAGGRRWQAACEHWQQRAQTSGEAPRLYGTELERGSTRNARYTLHLDRAAARRLDELCSDPAWRSFSPELSRFSIFATLLAAWIHRVSESKTAIFETPLAGRPSAEAKQAFGPFIELFGFRVEVADDATFRDLGSRCLAEAQELLRYGLPGSGSAQLDSSAGRLASNCVLNFFPGSFGSFAGQQPAVRWIHPGEADDAHALRLQVHDFDGRGAETVHLDLHQAHFGARSAEAKEHFERLLQALLEDPDQPIGTVDLLSDAENRRLRALHHSSASPVPPELPPSAPDTLEQPPLLLESLARQVASSPEAVAMRSGSEQLSYRELARRVVAGAQVLSQQGVAPGDCVALLCPRSIETVSALLSILACGAAWVPIPPRSPALRAREIVADSAADLLIGRAPKELADALGGTPVQLLEPGLLWQRADSEQPAQELQRLAEQIDSSALAYVLYTSGSTGRPKGVEVCHLGIADYLHWAQERYVGGRRWSYALATSLAFDLTLTSLFLPMITGGTLEIYPEGDGPVDQGVLDAAAEDRVDFLKVTPSHLALLDATDPFPQRLRCLVVGGEDFRTRLARSVSARRDNQLAIYNEYGPTEAVVGCVVHHFDPETDLEPSVPIGRPSPGVRVRITNSAGAAVPCGTPGELRVALRGLARGYRNLTGPTQRAFVADAEAPGGRSYRTGDRVRLNERGVLEFLGRTDRQLKISGHRIEPSEIESALQRHPGVHEAVVVPRRRNARVPAAGDAVRHCARCGLPSNYPRAALDENDICATCHTYDAIAERAQAYFRTPDQLAALFERSRQRHPQAPYDALLLLSGGKDSTYALCRLVDMGLRIRAFTFDNGYISEGAQENMRRVTEQLGVPLEIGSTPAMPEIFKDSLERFSNVCHGCFKTIYTLGIQHARAQGIPVVVTGLSRGQMFETRLTEEFFRDGLRPEAVDQAVLAARKVYHRVHDAVSRSLDVRVFRDDEIFEEIEIVDFYRYVDVGLDEVLAYLRREVPWVRPEDTGRSTNCLINDVGIWVHQRERRFHNYALPYSWDVRLGHKTREQALRELDDEIDETQVRRILLDIDYSVDEPMQRSRTELVAFWVPAEKESPIEEHDLRRHLEASVTAAAVPTKFLALDALPLTSNGKIDTAALERLAADAAVDLRPAAASVPLDGPVEEFLAATWRQELGFDDAVRDVVPLGAESHFFELGGTSLQAMQVMIRLCREFDIDLPLETIFEHPQLRQLSRLAEDVILRDVEAFEAAALDSPVDGDPAAG